MSAANRNRGHDCERNVARYLREQGWPDACTTRAKLGHDGATAPGDVDWHPLVTLEVKDVAASCWPTWCRQSLAEAPAGTVPVVVRRTRGTPDVGLWECRVRFADWIDAVDFDSAWRLGIEAVEVDGYAWQIQPFAAFVAAVRALDAAPVGGEGE